MRDALRRWLNRIVEPTHITGRHAPGVPTTVVVHVDFWADEWVATTWAEIAKRHDIKGAR